MEFASWLSPEFKLYLFTDYKRLKTEENSRLSLGWNLNRELSKINYRIHTDSIKENLMPKDISRTAQSYIYATEADVLNVAIRLNAMAIYQMNKLSEDDINNRLSCLGNTPSLLS